MNEKYKAIINQVHHQSSVHKRMSMYDRAAQFSSFAALTGHSEAICEEARLVDKRIVLNEEETAELNLQLNLICENISQKPCVKITYFIADTRKEGGAYVTEIFTLRTVDLVKRVLVCTEDKKEINIDDILKITGVE